MTPPGALWALTALLGPPAAELYAPLAGVSAPAGAAVDRAAPARYQGALRDDHDLLLLPDERRPPSPPTVVAATRARARSDLVANTLLDPATLRQALPALVRADVVATRPGPRADSWPDRLIAWELEIPLFNLEGKAWLRERGSTVEITLVEGAFAPGRVRFRYAGDTAGPAAGASAIGSTVGAATVVTCELQLDSRASNFVLRRVARHDPWAETAMSAAIAWVLVRAVSLRAEAARGGPPPRPRGAIQAPPASALDGSWLASPALAELRAGGTLVTVRRTPAGRLAWASVEVPVPATPTVVAARLVAPETWSVFPGWGSVTLRPAGSGVPGAAPSATLMEVDDNVPFVDLDAVWLVGATDPRRATVVEGATRGAVLGWQVFPDAKEGGKEGGKESGSPGGSPGGSLAVLSMHPRLDAAGFVERRLINAEPLLEHALAVALAYVDAAAVADSLAAPPRNR